MQRRWSGSRRLRLFFSGVESCTENPAGIGDEFALCNFPRDRNKCCGTPRGWKKIAGFPHGNENAIYFNAVILLILRQKKESEATAFESHRKVDYQLRYLGILSVINVDYVRTISDGMEIGRLFCGNWWGWGRNYAKMSWDMRNLSGTRQAGSQKNIAHPWLTLTEYCWKKYPDIYVFCRYAVNWVVQLLKHIIRPRPYVTTVRVVSTLRYDVVIRHIMFFFQFRGPIWCLLCTARTSKTEWIGYNVSVNTL